MNNRSTASALLRSVPRGGAGRAASQVSTGEVDVRLGDRDVAAKDPLEPAGVAYTAHLATGPVAETIHRYAQERNADEIVIGARGLGGVPGLLGSIATKVLKLATIPVTVVR